jgi:hypothetical protein
MMVKCRLSGTPDLLLNLANPRLLDDVRSAMRGEREKEKEKEREREREREREHICLRWLPLSTRPSACPQPHSFHPCIRLQKWSGENVLSFVPPVRMYACAWHIAVLTLDAHIAFSFFLFLSFFLSLSLCVCLSVSLPADTAGWCL